MKQRIIRGAAFAVVLGVGTLLLLLWAAHADFSAPPTPAQERVFPGSRFRAVFGQGMPDGQRLRVKAPGDAYSMLQVTRLPELDADAFPVLRYRFADFPRTLELSLVFRTAEHPDDAQTIALPWPGRGVSSVDLSQVPSWHGRVIELGFAEFATAQNVPPELGFRPFTLISAELWSPSWHGALAALRTDWLAAWPWSQRSVHALGREGDAWHARPMVVTVALAVVLWAACAVLLLGLRGRRLTIAMLVAAGIGWLALDLRWQWNLGQRLLAARSLYADVQGWPARSRIVGDAVIQRAADEVRTLAGANPPPRILVDGGTGYQTLRLVWHLLPLNVGTLPLALSHAHWIPDGTLIVFYDSTAWRDHPAIRRLLRHSRRIYAGDVVMAEGFEDPALIVFRYRHGD